MGDIKKELSPECVTTNSEINGNNGFRPEKHTNTNKPPWNIEFAPVNVPFERRIQTLATLFWVCIFLIIHPGGVLVLVYLFFYTNWWYLSLLYIGWIYLDRNKCNTGGRVLKMARESKLWKYYRDYFPVKLVKTTDLDPKKNYLFASHPHGVLSTGAFVCFGTEALGVSKLFPGLDVHFLTLRLNFLLPLFRELILILGMCSVTKECLKYLLSYPGGGKIAVLVPGGASESLDAHSGVYVMKLKSRKGFIKIALQNGISLVPVFCFGENDIYVQLNNPEGSLLRKVQNKLQKTISIAPVIVNGRGIFQYSYGLLPRRKPIVIVVGPPLEAKHISQPTQEQIDSHHEKYIEALKKLFYEYRDQYDDPKAEIKII